MSDVGCRCGCWVGNGSWGVRIRKEPGAIENVISHHCYIVWVRSFASSAVQFFHTCIMDMHLLSVVASFASLLLDWRTSEAIVGFNFVRQIIITVFLHCSLQWNIPLLTAFFIKKFMNKVSSAPAIIKFRTEKSDPIFTAVASLYVLHSIDLAVSSLATKIGQHIDKVRMHLLIAKLFIVHFAVSAGLSVNMWNFLDLSHQYYQ